MSGEKCARASLTDEAQSELRRVVDAARAMNDVRANAAAAREHAERLLAELKASIAEHMPAELVAFQAAVAPLDDLCERLRQKLAEVGAQEQAAAGGTVEERRDRALYLQAEARALAQRVEAQAREVTALAQRIADGLDRAVLAADHARIRAALRRSRIAELRARIRQQLGADGRGELRWVREDADRLDSALAGLEQDPEQATEPVLERARAELANMTERARQLDYENAERWDMASRLHNAFERVGFRLARAPGDPVQVGAGPVRFRHELNEHDHQAATETSLEQGGTIYLEMTGTQGLLSTTVTASETCGGTIEDLVREAKNLGLVIREVLWKGPGGWETIHRETGAAAQQQRQIQKELEAPRK